MAIQQWYTKDKIDSLFVAFRGSWIAGTSFPKNSLVLQNNAVYLAVADVPARGTFTATDWQILSGGTTNTSNLATTDTADGYYSITGAGVTDNSDGFYTLNDSTVTDNGDGYYSLAA